MTSKSKLLATLMAGALIGAGAVQVLHAQAKPKAYVVTELEVIDAEAAKAFVPKAEAAQAQAGAVSFQTGGGMIVGLEGGAPPPRVALMEFKSAEAAKAFYTSKAWLDLKPERDKAVKTIRRYAVEARQ
jgi:uncharacterized protein (DUF1330 family)